MLGALALVFPWIVVAIAPAAAAPCTFEPIPMAAPKPAAPAVTAVESYAFVNVRAAGKDVALSITFDASGPAWLGWQRITTGGKPDLRQRLQIERRPAGSSAFEAYCEGGWIPLSQLPSFGRLKLDAGAPATWRVLVFQDNLTPAVSVLDEDLSQVVIGGSIDPQVTVDPAPLPSFDSVRRLPSRPPPACDTSIAAAPPDAELLHETRLPADALNVPGSIHALSGRNLFLKVGHLDLGTPVTVVFEAKPIRLAAPAVPICVMRLAQDSRTSGQWIMAALPWEYEYQGDWVRWTVTFVGERPSPGINFQLYRDRAPSRPPIAEPRGPDVYSCTRASPHPNPDTPSDFTATFQGAYALTVRTGLREMGVSGKPYFQIVDALLSAINNWRNACTRCTPYQFSVIAVDSDVYVPHDMLTGAPENYRATFATNYPWSTHVRVDKNDGFRTSFIPFVRTSGTLRQRRRFCNQAPEPKNRFSAAASPLCRPSTVSNEDEMIINMTWSSDALPCGQRAESVACWNGTDRITMNLHEFSFYAGDVGGVLLGSSPLQADLVRVFTHEVGHWLGLGHLQPDGSIMSEHFSAARCIDDAALMKLNAIASGLELPSYAPESLLYDQ